MLKIAKVGVPLTVTPPVQLLVHLYVQPSSPLPVQPPSGRAGVGTLRPPGPRRGCRTEEVGPRRTP
ncbi:hypothetical protein GCM10010493_42470 [Streptomyces lavendulae subsp. grasserius]